MKSRSIRVLLFTLALTLLALSFCALAYADGASVVTPAGCGSFDVLGDGVSATVDGAGFRSYVTVSGGAPVRLSEGGAFSFGQEYGTDTVKVSLSASTGFGGKAAVIGYSIRNASEEPLVIRCGNCGNTAVGTDGGAAVYARGGGFVSESGGQSVLVFPGALAFDGAWCGAVGENTSKLCYTDQNCDMAWYWYLYLQPGQTAWRTVVIAAGNVQRCSVFFEPNGGVNLNSDLGSRQERLAILGCDYALPSSPFERGAYRFLGWAVDKDAEKPNYSDAGTIPASEVHDGMTLYAVWQDKAQQTIEADHLSLSFGDTGVRLNARSSDGKISYAVKTGADVIDIDAVSGTIVTRKVGVAEVTITAAATSESNAAQKDVTVTVNPKSLDGSMILLSPASFSYNGQFQAPSISVRHGERTLLRSRDYTLDESSVLTASELGEYAVKVTGTGNYVGSASAVWKITKRTPSAELTAYSGGYDGSAHALASVLGHEGGTLQFSLSENGPYSDTIPAASAAGTYTLWYRIVGDEQWLDMAPRFVTASISKKSVAVSGIRAEDKLYDGSTSAQLCFDDAQIDGLCAGDDVVLRSASGMFADADAGQDKRVRISAITLGGADAGNYALSPMQQQSEASAAISPRPLTVTAKDQAVPLYGKISGALDQVSASGLTAYDELNSIQLSSGSTLNSTKAGTITAASAVIVRKGSTQNVSANYAVTYMPGTLVVGQVELKLSWKDTEFVYDGKSHKPTATVSGTLNGEVVTVNVSGAKTDATPEGEIYTATAVSLSGKTAGNYKLPANATQTFKITPKSLESDTIFVDYRPGDDPSVIGPVPADGKSYGFRSIAVYDGQRKLTKDVDYTLDSNYSAIYGPHTLHIIGKGNYIDSISREWTLIGDGLVTASVEIKSGGAEVYWNNASETIADALLDEDDRQVREEYGAPTDVYLQIRPAVVSSGVAAKASQLGETVGANYDLSLNKRVGNDSVTIRDTGGIPISITLDVPEELRKAPLGYYRSFTLIHLHNGTAEVIASGTGSSFTFTTTSFSAYAISYHDIQLPPNSSPPTGDTARVPLWSTMLLLSAAGLLCLTRRRRRT